MYSESTSQLVKHLDHPNGWWRMTAQKLIILRGEKSVVAELRAMVKNAKTALGKIHALWTLEGLGAVDAESIQLAVKDSNPDIRYTAIRAAESSLQGNAVIAAAIHSLAKDDAPSVLIQYCLTVNHLKLPDAKERIGAVLAATQSEGVKTLAGKILGKLHSPKVSVLSKKDRAIVDKGEGIYKSLCFSCHGMDGKGVKSPAGLLAPPFKGSKCILGHSSMGINILLHGLTGPIEGKKYAGLMVPMASNGDEWIAAVLSYIRNSFGNEADMVTADMVASVRKGNFSRKTPWTVPELYAAIPQSLKNKDKWTIRTSHNQAGTKYIADGKLEPRWASEATMQSGMWITVELPAATNINAVRIDAASSKEDHPRDYDFFVSDDGQNWRLISKGKGDKALVEIQFPIVKAKHIKVLLTSGSSKYWSIHEMEIFEKP